MSHSLLSNPEGCLPRLFKVVGRQKQACVVFEVTPKIAGVLFRGAFCLDVGTLTFGQPMGFP